MKRLPARTIALALLLLATPTTRALAAPGDLVPDFGGFGDDGRIQGLGFEAKGVAMDAQGRLVIAGNAGNTFHVQRRSGPRFSVVESVSITIDPAQTSALVGDVAVAPDGKIVVAGTVSFAGGALDFAVARLKDDLSLDETFDGDGTTSLDFADDEDFGYGVAVQDDLKIVVAGWAFVDIDQSNDMGVARFREDGAPDPEFSDDGKVVIDREENIDTAYDVAVDLGKIYVAGYASGGLAVVRLNSDGARDDSFGDEGIAAGDAEPTALGIAVRHGDVVVAGGEDVIEVARYLSNGTPDDNFDFDGHVTTDVAGNARPFAVVIQPDAKVVVLARNSFDADPDLFLLARYNVNGTLDDTFGDGGIVTTAFGAQEASPDALLLQPDGWLVAVGGPNAARYRSNGSLDAGGAVQVIFDPLQVSAQLGGLVVDSERRIVAAGHVEIGEESSDIALARFSSALDGTLDTTYGNGDPKLGVTVTGTGLDEQVHALALEGTKAVVGGQIGASPDINFLVGRYTATGEADGSCAIFGFNVQDFDGGDDIARAVAFGDGKIFLAGTATGPTSDYGVAAFNSSDCTLNAQFGRERVDMGSTDAGAGVVVQTPRIPVSPFETKAVLAGTAGSDIGLTRVEIEPIIGPILGRDVDPGFGTNGRTIVPTGGSETVSAMARLSDGSLLVGGWNASIDNSDFFLARFSAGGIHDTTFGTDGFAYADFGVSDQAHAVAIRGDGTIALAGCNTDFGSRIAIAQFTPSGQLDTGFSEDGLLEIEIGGGDCARAVRFLPPKFIVVGGYADGGGSPSFVVAQIETTQDPTATTTTTTTTTVTTTTVTTTTVTVPTTSTTLATTTTTTPTTSTTLSTTTTVSTTSTTSPTSTTVSTTTTTLPVGTCGDPNGNEAITASDALFVLRAAVGSGTCAPCVCDTNASGDTSASDALLVLQVAVGQSVELQCPPCT